MKTVQVFDWLEMPDDISTPIATYFEAANDSYHRWYPNEASYGVDPLLFPKVNEWLTNQGLVIEDPTDKYFYVLIYISW